MKASFFKLPLIFTLVYALISVVIGFTYTDSMEDGINVGFILDNIIFSVFHYSIPEYLWMIFISSLVLNRCHAYYASSKNIITVVAVALVVVVVIHLFYRFVSADLFELMVLNNSYSFYDLTYLSYRIITDSALYIISGLITYFGILSLQQTLDKEETGFTMWTEQSNKIHLILFMILFTFVYYSISFSLIGAIIDIRLLGNNDIILTNFVVMIIIASVVFLLIKNRFTNHFNSLQIGRIVKCVVLCVILTGVLNLIIMMATLFSIFIGLFDSYEIINFLFLDIFYVIFFVSIVLQVMCSILIIRALTTKYFAIPYNSSTVY